MIFCRNGSVAARCDSASNIGEKFQKTTNFLELQIAVTLVLVKVSSKTKLFCATFKELLQILLKLYTYPILKKSAGVATSMFLHMQKAGFLMTQLNFVNFCTPLISFGTLRPILRINLRCKMCDFKITLQSHNDEVIESHDNTIIRSNAAKIMTHHVKLYVEESKKP